MNRQWLVAFAVLAGAPASFLACGDDSTRTPEPVTPGGSDASIDSRAPSQLDGATRDAAPQADAAGDARDGADGRDAAADTGADAGTRPADGGGDADAGPTFVPPVIDGMINPAEYGEAVDGKNQQTVVQGATRTWYMTWDEQYLYVAVKQVGGYDAVFLEIDTDADPLTDAGAAEGGAPDGGSVDAGALDGGASDAGPVDGGVPDASVDAGHADAAAGASDAASPSSGTYVLLPYDGVSGTTTLGADFVLYWKNDYDEYKTSESASAWSEQLDSRKNTLGNGKQSSYDSVNQIDYREARIPWTTIRAAGRPASFKWLGYAVNASQPYGQVPPENLAGAADAGSTVAFTHHYSVRDATPVTGTRPFAVVAR